MGGAGEPAFQAEETGTHPAPADLTGIHGVATAEVGGAGAAASRAEAAGMGMEQAHLAGRHGVEAVLCRAGTAGAPLAGAEQAQEKVGSCLVTTGLLVNLHCRIHARKVCLSADTLEQGASPESSLSYACNFKQGHCRGIQQVVGMHTHTGVTEKGSTGSPGVTPGKHQPCPRRHSLQTSCRERRCMA